MIDHRKHKVVQKLLNHKVINLYESIKETCAMTGISDSVIRECCTQNKISKVKRSTGGYIFEYYDSTDDKTKEKVKQLKQDNGT